MTRKLFSVIRICVKMNRLSGKRPGKMRSRQKCGKKNRSNQKMTIIFFLRNLMLVLKLFITFCSKVKRLPGNRSGKSAIARKIKKNLSDLQLFWVYST